MRGVTDLMICNTGAVLYIHSPALEAEYTIVSPANLLCLGVPKVLTARVSLLHVLTSTLARLELLLSGENVTGTCSAPLAAT